MAMIMNHPSVSGRGGLSWSAAPAPGGQDGYVDQRYPRVVARGEARPSWGGASPSRRAHGAAGLASVPPSSAAAAAAAATAAAAAAAAAAAVAPAVARVCRLSWKCVRTLSGRRLCCARLGPIARRWLRRAFIGRLSPNIDIDAHEAQQNMRMHNNDRYW